MAKYNIAKIDGRLYVNHASFEDEPQADLKGNSLFSLHSIYTLHTVYFTESEKINAGLVESLKALRIARDESDEQATKERLTKEIERLSGIYERIQLQVRALTGR